MFFFVHSVHYCKIKITSNWQNFWKLQYVYKCFHKKKTEGIEKKTKRKNYYPYATIGAKNQRLSMFDRQQFPFITCACYGAASTLYNAIFNSFTYEWITIWLCDFGRHRRCQAATPAVYIYSLSFCFIHKLCIVKCVCEVNVLIVLFSSSALSIICGIYIFLSCLVHHYMESIVLI